VCPRRRSAENATLVGAVEDGREARREAAREEGRVVPVKEVFQAEVSVERWVLSARRREVERPLRKEEADCRDLASWGRVSWCDGEE